MLSLKIVNLHAVDLSNYVTQKGEVISVMNQIKNCEEGDWKILKTDRTNIKDIAKPCENKV